jgi:hypothetical protein
MYAYRAIEIVLVQSSSSLTYSTRECPTYTVHLKMAILDFANSAIALLAS